MRKALLADLDSLLALNRNSLDARDAFSRANLRAWLKRARVWIAQAGPDAAGFCIVNTRGYVLAVAVAPLFRRKRMGETLLRAAIAAGAYRCEIRASNVISERMFRRAGFAPRALKPAAYADGEAAMEFMLDKR